MLECLRVLIHTPDWEPTYAIIFCESLESGHNLKLTRQVLMDAVFNNAEESLQDGSHLYSTQHPTAKT